MACPIGPGTWDAALAASEVATTAADMVLDGGRQAYLSDDLGRNLVQFLEGL